MYVCRHAFLCVKARGLYLFISLSPSILFCEMGYLAEPEVRQQIGCPESSEDPSVSASPNTEFINTRCHTPFLPGYWGPKTQLLMLVCKCSHPLSDLLSPHTLLLTCYFTFQKLNVCPFFFFLSFFFFYRDWCSGTYGSPNSIFTISVFTGKKKMHLEKDLS